jgi:glycosyltransferase involved in cell wall biosynthesis
MTAAPLVSVVIPVFNGARLLPDALASARAQDYAPLEIVVVDDASSDGSGDVAARAGAKVVRLPRNIGAAAARNRGVAEARGAAIAFLDADDTWPPGRLRRLMDRLTATPPVDMVCGRTRAVGRIDAAYLRPELAANPHVHALLFGSAVIRREVFARVGPIAAEYRIGHDTDWFLRAREAGIAIAVLDEDVLDYRLHDANMTRDAGATIGDLATALKRSLDRRRGQHGGTAADLPRWTARGRR